MREQLIAELQNAKATIEKMNGLKYQISQYEQQKLQLQDKIQKIRDDQLNYTFGYAFEIVFVTICLIACIIDGASILATIFLVLAGLILGMYIHSLLNEARKTGHSKKAYERRQKAAEYVDETIQATFAEIEEIEVQIASKAEEISTLSVPEWLDESYRQINIIDFLINVIQKGNADTLKEALNLYEDYLYKEKMLDMQKKQVDAQNQQAIQIEKKENDKKRKSGLSYVFWIIIILWAIGMFM